LVGQPDGWDKLKAKGNYLKMKSCASSGSLGKWVRQTEVNLIRGLVVKRRMPSYEIIVNVINLRSSKVP